MKKILRTAAMVIMVAVALTSCAGKASKIFDYGTIDGNKYTNSYFGLTVTFPEGWYPLSQQEIAAAGEMSGEMITNKEIKDKVIKAVDIKTAILFQVFEHELGATSGFNPSLGISIENKNGMNTRNGQQYINILLKSIGQSGIPYINVEPEIVADEIGCKEFYRIDMQMDLAGFPVKQSIYASIVNGFALVITTTYINEEQQEQLETMLDTIEFEK